MHMPAAIRIDTTACLRDGICIAVCPMLVFREDKENPRGVPVVTEHTASRCIGCGHCVAVCPPGAITLNDVGAAQVRPLTSFAETFGADVARLIRGRRSTRHYKSAPVSPELIEELVDTADFAPTGHNARPVRWLAVNSVAATNRLSRLTYESMKASGFMHGMAKAYERGVDVILRHAPAVVMAVAGNQGFNPQIDCAVAVATLELAAAARGLGGCWAGVLMHAARDYAPLREHLGLAPDEQVHGALLLGWPKYRFRREAPHPAPKFTWIADHTGDAE